MLYNVNVSDMTSQTIFTFCEFDFDLKYVSLIDLCG